ncbi:MAG: hypothetical protein ACRECD_03540 [Burkholderiaceae bacterium]
MDVPDAPLAMTLLWIWLVIVVTVVAGYLIFRWWRKRHPPAKAQSVESYSEALHRRLASHRTGKPPGRPKRPGGHVWRDR